MEIDTINKHLIIVKDDKVMIMSPAIGSMTSMEAKQLAAWLVCMAGIVSLGNDQPVEPTFEEILDKVIGC